MNVFLSDEQDEPLDGAALRSFASFVLGDEGLPPETEVAIVLVGPEQMAEYNRAFMNRRGPTDVLAFPVSELTPGHPPTRMANDPPVALGDVFLCPSVIKGHAEEEGRPFDDWMHLLVAHGILHLLGYDHADDRAAEQMEQRERELLAGAGRNPV